jgi:hypothetical protein
LAAEREDLMACLSQLPNKERIEKLFWAPRVAPTRKTKALIGDNRLLRGMVLAVSAGIALMLAAVVGGPTRQSPTTTRMPSALHSGSVEKPASRPQGPERLSAAEFARLIRDFSEDGGYFLSDNLTSNETAYLHVVSKLRELGATGGAYIGVGPEQNFTYIAKVRPRIAFIVDIRRQAMIQHLMFKAVFHLAPSRLQYLSLLLSRPVLKEIERIPAADAPVSDIIALISRLPATDRAYEANVAAIRKAIREDFQVQLTAADLASLDYLCKSFRTDGLGIAFRMDGVQFDWFPTMKDLILEPDQFGKLGNFLASKEDYEFVRELHERNMIIPVVGDFAGKKALLAVGDYLRKNGYTVSAFYTSNVEQYLFENSVFPGFVANVRRLPLGERSLFIRAVLNMRYSHPASAGSHMLTTLLQQMTVFVKDFDAGLYRSYADMVTTHYIAGEAPVR